MVDVLYSLVDVNVRFNQIILDRFYIRNLNLTSMKMKSLYNRTYSTNENILQRICSNILPRIDHQINELIIEQSSIERILHPHSYLQLHSLKLWDFSGEVLLNYVTNDEILRQLMIEQIIHLEIDVNDSSIESSLQTLPTVLTLLLSLCKRLITFNFGCFFHRGTVCTFDSSTIDLKSSSLTSLLLNVSTFNDCLHLLDGRLDSLSKLIIHITDIQSTSETIENTTKLPKLKHFSLTSHRRTASYDRLVIPLLRRMVNLEELILYLTVLRSNKDYIDGHQLHNDFLISMPRLNKFRFKIDTHIVENNIEMVFSSNEDIQRSLKREEYGPVGLFIDDSTRDNEGKDRICSMAYQFISRCHIYSLPYQFDSFCYLTNSFPGGIFESVLTLVLMDFRPFEHHFFKIISQSFPFLKQLIISNSQPQKEKQESMTPITFSHLVALNLHFSHRDYAKQLLIEKYCQMPRLLNLRIGYESLAIVTNNFTNDATRLTCSQLTNVNLDISFVLSKEFYQYFPSL